MAEQAPQRRSRPAETPEDKKVWRTIILTNAVVDRCKDLMLYGASLVVIMSISGVCVWVIVAPPTEHAFTWATGTLSSMVTGIVAYIYGRATNPANRQDVRVMCEHVRDNGNLG